MIKNVDALLGKMKDEIKSKTDIAVVGLSGGADSTLVATLCTLALGKDNVYGLHMPYNKTDDVFFNARSNRLASKLGIKNYTVKIASAVDALTVECAGNSEAGKLSNLNQGNIRSRMRMVSLYTTACMLSETTGKRVRVVGTGNLSEDFIGYDTKGGDALTDFFPIGQLFKSEVYQLLEYFVNNNILTEDLVDRVPSAGLWDGQTDEGELGHTYNEMEPSILRCLAGNRDTNNPIDEFVWNRHINNKHKHEAPPVIDLGDFRF